MTISTARTIWADAMDSQSPAEYLAECSASEIAAGAQALVDDFMVHNVGKLRELGYDDDGILDLEEAMVALLAAEIAA